jgi:hypothetical protein
VIMQFSLTTYNQAYKFFLTILKINLGQ